MRFRFFSERDLLEAISAYYGVIEDADLIQSMLPAPDPPRAAAKLRVTLGVSALRLLSLQRTADPPKVPPACETAGGTISCNRCAGLPVLALWPEDLTDWPRFHRCKCGRVLVESPPTTHDPHLPLDDEKTIRRPLNHVSPEAWRALLDQVMSARDADELG